MSLVAPGGRVAQLVQRPTSTSSRAALVRFAFHLPADELGELAVAHPFTGEAQVACESLEGIRLGLLEGGDARDYHVSGWWGPCSAVTGHRPEWVMWRTYVAPERGRAHGCQ